MSKLLRDETRGERETARGADGVCKRVEMRSAKLKPVSSGCEGRGKKSLNWQSMSRLSKLNSTMFDKSKGSSREDEREDVEEELEECEWERLGTPNGTPISMGWVEAGEECIESGREDTRLTGDG